MRVTLRAKLMAIVGTAAMAFVVLVAAGMLTTRRTETTLQAIEGQYLPKLDLRPRLEAQLERMQRAFQDSVSAHDVEALGTASEARDAFLGSLASGASALDRSRVEQLRAAVEEYDRSAADLSRRLIQGETGEPILAAMTDMQAKRNHVAALLQAATALEEGELPRAFRAASQSLKQGSRIRFVISVTCLVLVIGLSAWLGRGVLRTLASLGRGLERFGAGDFAQPIAVEAGDELGDLASRANDMAASLRRLSEERDRNDWLRSGLAGLATELRGELSPSEVGARALHFVSKKVDAPAAALYETNADGTLSLLAQHALGGAAAPSATPSIKRGEGLVGQAALQEAPTIIANPPADYLRLASGLGEAAPRAIVLVPLLHAGHPVGVLELATFSPWTELKSELILSVRETLAIAIIVARGRAAMRDLLTATQQQAERLTAQEEELRATNEELQVQEEELRQANTDLSQRTSELEAQRVLLAARNSELDDARIRLEQRASELATVSSYKSQFLANMSHELRTPLNSMLLLSNLLADNEGGTLSPQQVEFARTIYGAGKDLLGLINQVLDLAKVESGRQEIKLGPVNLADVISQLSRVFLPLAQDKGLEFRTFLASDMPPVIVTDRRRLEQILTNLIGNAVKFTARGSITFRIERSAPGARYRRPELAGREVAVLSVADTGLGIAPDDQERVFAPFEQVDGAVDRRYGGTGLGLGIAREMATLLGGELQLQSALGTGSTFSLLIPITVGDVAAEEREAPAAQPHAPSPIGRSGPSLLLIEDDPVFAKTFGDLIRSHGVRYTHARDGRTGLELARDLRPTGIILDVKLPDTDGWSVMEALRADPSTAQIPVHFVSALDGAERGLALGAVGYVKKPVTRRDLIRVIDALVPPLSARTSRFLVVEDDSATATSVVRMLEGEGLEALSVASAERALDLIRRERFGCMILDLSLPEMSGLDLLRIIRDEGVPDPPRIVVYTARSLSRAETMTIEAYAQAVVLKTGASVERLLDEVRLFVRHLGRGRGDEPTGNLDVARVNVDLGGKKVLLADDDMRTIYALSAILRSRGLEVLVADTGRAAVETLKRQPNVAVVLMDIMMPEMDGYEAMRRIRSDQRFADLPIIALTAKAMKGDEEKCVEAGASHYMPKPIDPDRLMALIERCLARAVEASANG